MAVDEYSNTKVQLALTTCTQKGVHPELLEASDKLTPCILYLAVADTKRLCEVRVSSNLGF